MIVSFLYKTFIQPNVRTIPQPELASRLADYLYGLRERLGEEAFPRRAEQYLDDWASDNRGWLRKYYPSGDDEAHYDLTPPTERAMDWLVGFNQREFIGAESRLMTVITLLREIAEGTEMDPGLRSRASALVMFRCSIQPRSKTDFNKWLPRRAACCRISAKWNRISVL